MSDGLGDARSRFANGEITAPEFHARFVTSRVFFLTGEQPCCVVFGEPPGGVAPVFSALSELARFVLSCPELATQENRWASTVGAEILALVLPGYHITLDPTSSDPVTIPSDARRVETVLVARRVRDDPRPSRSHGPAGGVSSPPAGGCRRARHPPRTRPPPRPRRRCWLTPIHRSPNSGSAPPRGS